MEKIVVGAPYEISIEPSIDIGKFDCELIIIDDDLKFGTELKPVKGENNNYTFIISSKLSTLLKKKEVAYSIFVYKENARFEVDDGKMKFIDESDFKVLVKDNAKMRKVEDNAEAKPKPTKAKPKDKDPTPTPTPSAVSEAEAQAQAILEKHLTTPPVAVQKAPNRTILANPNQYDEMDAQASEAPDDLKVILRGIEDRNKKRQINERIQNALKNK